MSEPRNNQPNDAAPLRSHEAEAMDRWLDAGLDEALGGERAPDVTAQVLARAAAGERPLLGPGDGPVSAGLWRQLWLAALLLLGLGVVGGVAWMQRAGAGHRGDSTASSMQDPAEDDLVVVRSRKDIASLPTDLRAVKVELGKRGMEELVARCPHLEVLHVQGNPGGVHPSRHQDDSEANAEELAAQIARLDALQDLRLTYVPSACSVLPPLRGLRQLRSLSLEGLEGVDDAGVEAVAMLRDLRRLRIDVGPRVGRLETTPLAALQQLQDFEFNYWVPGGPVLESGVDDEAIQSWPNLRRLSIPRAAVTARIGTKLLANTPALVELELGTSARINLDTVRDILRLPQLQKLRIERTHVADDRGFRDFTGDVVPLLTAANPLRDVDLGVAPWFTLEHAATLLAAGKRVRVERDDLAFQQQLAELHRQHTYRQIHSVTDVKALTPIVTHVQVRNHGDRVALALRECPWLEVVEFVRDDEDPLTATGLDAVLALPVLRGLHVVGVDDLPADALRSLATCKTLRELRLTGCAVDDDVLAVLPSLPELRELELLAVRGFGDLGMRGIAGCRRLRALTLSSCKHLSTEQLALVGELRSLARLALADLPNLRDRAVRSLLNLRDLQDLDLSRGPFTKMGLIGINQRTVRRLVLAECVGVGGTEIINLPSGIEELDLSGCPLDATTPALLRDRFPALRKLVLRDADWLDDEGFRALLAAPSLEHLAAKGCTKMTPVHADAIRAAKRLRFLDISRSTCVRDEDVPGLAADRPDLQIVRKVW